MLENYGVTTLNLNKAVKRNRNRFPDDFMFQFTKEENESLRFQTGISKPVRRGGRHSFTEQGVAMLSSVLHGDTAVAVNIAIMRAVVQLREILSTHKDLARKLDALEKKYDENFQTVFEAIRQLMAPPSAPDKTRKFGFARDY